MMEIPEDLYFSTLHNKFINERDILPYEDWLKDPKEFTVSQHPEGFLIFIPHEKAILVDEYDGQTGDPYWEKNHPSYVEAEKRMIGCTLELIEISGIIDEPSTRILDVACGKGNITERIKNRFPSATIIGLDISLTAVREAALKKHKDIRFLVANAFELPFAQGTFDLVVCNNLWEHITDPFRLGTSLNRIMKPNGALIISTPSRYNFENLWSVIHGNKVNFQNPTFHLTEYSIGQVKEHMTRSGFSVEKIITKPMPLFDVSWKTRVKHKVVKPVIGKLLKLINSHHILETTAFFLARKKHQK